MIKFIRKTFYYLALLATVTLFVASASSPAQAACSSPTRDAGAIIYNSDAKVFQYCNDTNWVAAHHPGTGTGGCTNPVRNEGAVIYNSVARVMQGCAGDVWRPMGPVGGKVGWIQVSAGETSTCGTRSDGSGWCWGYDDDEKLGNGAVLGDTTSPSQEFTSSSRWTIISASRFHSCGVQTDGTLWCWGSDITGQLGNGAGGDSAAPVQETTAATNWKTVSAGENHTCAVKTNGTLWCWGDDGNLTLGNGATTGIQQSPVQEASSATDWDSVSSSQRHTCAVKTNGTLWCWGIDTNGRLGNGAGGNANSPVQESSAATNWRSVAQNAQASHSCAVKTNGTLWCWGWDGGGQLGNGVTSTDQQSPVQESSNSTDWSMVSVGVNYTCAVKTNGTLWCWGTDNYTLGDGPEWAPQASPVQEATYSTDWVSVSAGWYHTCALKNNGSLWCWGQETYGELGNGDKLHPIQPSPVPEATRAMNWGFVSAGYWFGCAIKTNRTLWCWGDDTYGEIADGPPETFGQNAPIQEATASSSWMSVASGRDHGCGLRGDGTIWCWGRDNYGQIGNGVTTGDQRTPVQETTNATDWSSLTVGDTHSCAIKTSGSLWCWGRDNTGQLGNGATAGDQVSPIQEVTSALDWTSVTAGNGHTCAIKSNGTLWCWGTDGSGQLGNGGVAGDQISPTQESTLATDWISVSAGNGFTCATKTDGSVWCWGSDSVGQLGNGAVAGNQTSPSRESTNATDWASVDSGDSHACAVKRGGTLWCWGDDAYGALGNGQLSGNQISPSQESDNATSWTSVSAGNDTTCALMGSGEKGELYCWGSNNFGELGAGLPLGDTAIASNECQFPTRSEGAILYNSSSNVMQYCDGVVWTRVGFGP